LGLLQSDKWLFVHVPKTAGTSISNVLKEKDCVELATHGKLESQRDLGNRFVFAFVRNPFEWFGSLYYSHIRQHRKLSIEEFIKTHESWNYFFDTQTSWIKYNGLLDRINFIGKYENLNKDFKIVCERIDYKDRGLTLENYNTIRDVYPNMDMYDYYRKRCYTNPKVVEFVREKYKEDFKNFDYGLAL